MNVKDLTVVLCVGTVLLVSPMLAHAKTTGSTNAITVLKADIASLDKTIGTLKGITIPDDKLNLKSADIKLGQCVTSVCKAIVNKYFIKPDEAALHNAYRTLVTDYKTVILDEEALSILEK